MFTAGQWGCCKNVLLIRSSSTFCLPVNVTSRLPAISITSLPKLSTMMSAPQSLGRHRFRHRVRPQKNPDHRVGGARSGCDALRRVERGGEADAAGRRGAQSYLQRSGTRSRTSGRLTTDVLANLRRSARIGVSNRGTELLSRPQVIRG